MEQRGRFDLFAPNGAITPEGAFFMEDRMVEEKTLYEAAEGAANALAVTEWFGGYVGPWYIWKGDVIVVALDHDPGGKDTDVYLYDQDELCAWWEQFNDEDGHEDTSFLYEGNKLRRSRR